jgi:hypothetical protein
VKREWKSIEDSVLFWSTDYDDDPSLKLALVIKMAESPFCSKCSPLKEWHCIYLNKYIATNIILG